MLTRFITRQRWLVLFVTLLAMVRHVAADNSFDKALKPAFTEFCIKCHGQEKVKGKVNLHEIKTEAQWLANPELIKKVIQALDSADMPPQDEPQLDETKRAELVAALKGMLSASTVDAPAARNPISRLNRFQYNNAIGDLFQLKSNVFFLPEKLMTRHDNYLASSPISLPDRVDVACHSLEESGGFKNVQSYPKDLRAQHGFDNQASQLTLSPLLLESFLKLSVSILDSPDFNEKTVGIWNEFFREPQAGAKMKDEIRKRLRPFLAKAFRSSVDDATLDRYTDYTLSKINEGVPFTDCMKKVASAALCSPKFLFRTVGATGDQYALASRLSFFLWNSGPDEKLLALADSGELAKPEVLKKTIERMIVDPKIEGFLDAFPAQWMQLENILASVPDPNLNRYFKLDKENPASLQMVLEPLLLFDAVFIEDRPIVELLAPAFSYRSEFLQTWYSSELKPPVLNIAQIAEANRKLEEQRIALEQSIQTAHAELAAMVDPVKEQLLARRVNEAEVGNTKPIDLKPYAAWEFNGDLTDSVGGLDLKAQGKIQYKDGMVVLDGAFLQSKGLPIELKAKTLEIWLLLKNAQQSGGGAMTVQGPGDFFDSIVLGERKAGHWISGSNGHSRTLDFEGSTPEPEGEQDQLLHLVMVYQADGTTTLYRNGVPYGKPYRKGKAAFPKEQTSVLFGLRHLPPGGNKSLAMNLDRARLYDRALTATEVAASAGDVNMVVTDKELLAALTAQQRARHSELTATLKKSETAANKLPKPLDPQTAKQEAQNRFENEIRNQIKSRVFQREANSDPRYGGVITNAAVMTMTSSSKRTLPIARGAWVIEVILNDPPPPPPNDVPPLNEESGPKNLTIREKFAQHRANPSCAGCHTRIDPLGFALENFDITGRWRDKYENGRDVDASGTLMKKHKFESVVQFKASLVQEKERFAKAFTEHLLRFALSRELEPADILTVDEIILHAKRDDYRMRSILRHVIQSDLFLQLK